MKELKEQPEFYALLAGLVSGLIWGIVITHAIMSRP